MAQACVCPNKDVRETEVDKAKLMLKKYDEKFDQPLKRLKFIITDNVIEKINMI